MTKKTIYGGVIILGIFTVLVAVGIFLMQRYNGIANAEAKVKEHISEIDATVTDQKDQVQKLLDATKKLEKSKEYTALTLKNISLEKSPAQFFKDDTTFQKNVQTYVAVVSQDAELSKNDTVTNILGQIQGDEADLRNEKVAYNAAVVAYNAKRTARPQFYGQLLGFRVYDSFANITAPLDSTPGQNTEDQNQNPDVNSFN